MSGERPVPGFGQVRVLPHEFERVATRLFENGRIGEKVGDPEEGHSALTSSKKIPRTPDLKISLRDPESVGIRDQRLQPSLRKVDILICGKHCILVLFPHFAGQKDAVRLLGSSPHPSSQLVELGKPEPFRVLDDVVTISVALGMSIPTSITVVATRMSISPAAKPVITRSFSSPGSLPWSKPTLSWGKTRVRR